MYLLRNNRKQKLLSWSIAFKFPCKEKESTGKREKEREIWEQKWQMVL